MEASVEAPTSAPSLRRSAVAALARLNPMVAVQLAFGASFVVLALVGWTLYSAMQEAREARAWVLHTNAVLHAIDESQENFALAESAHRGWLLAGQAQFVQRRDRALNLFRDSSRRVVELTVDNPSQQAQALRLQELAVTRSGQLAAEERQAPAQGQTIWPAESMQAALEARAASALLTGGLELEQRRLLAARMDHDRQQQEEAFWLLFVALLAGLAVVVPAYWALLHQSRKRMSIERQMTELVEQLPVTVWQAETRRDGSRVFVYVGESAANHRGVDAESLRKDMANALNSICEEDRAMVDAAMQEAERNLQPLDVQYRVRMPTGALQWIRSSATLRRRADGTILWSGYWANITTQKELEQALQDATDAANLASRAKTTFLATMSHEIRTPMNGMLGLLELMSLSGLDAEQRATLAVVRESGHVLMRIIDDILDFSKVEAGRLDLHPAPASVAQAVQRTIDIHSGMAASRRLVLEHHTDPRISPALVFDTIRVGQILNNLVGNAIKFTKHGGVKVAAELVERAQGQDTIRFTISDSGIGVTAEAMRALFQPFMQAAIADGENKQGSTGLGLAICRRLAHLMGGEVRMESSPGVGTTMYFTASFAIAKGVEAPREAAHQQLQHEVGPRRAAPTAEEAEAEGTLVLLVDDHPTNRILLGRQLAALGYGVVTAEDGLQALEVWQRRRVALVLTDCNMPGMNGYDLARAIRQAEAATGARPVPIVACTANAMSSEAAACLDAGMNDTLVKPVSLTGLMLRLDEWLRLPTPPAALPGTTPTPARGGMIDHEMIAAMGAGDPQSEREVLMALRQANAQDGAALVEALAADNLDLVVHLAHRIQGVCRMVGARGLSGVCEHIGMAARAGDAAAARRRLPTFEAELGSLEGYLNGLLEPARTGAFPGIAGTDAPMAKGLRFLVVEDHSVQQRMMARMLTAAGAAAIEVAADGAKALQLLLDEARPVDIVITDLSMPGMDGLEFMRHLSRLDKTPSLIVCSAMPARLLGPLGELARATRLNVLGVVEKPLTPDKLRSMIEAHQQRSADSAGTGTR